MNIKKLLLLLYFFIVAILSFAKDDPSDLFKKLQNCHDSLKSGIYCDLAYYYLDSAGNKSLVFSQKALNYATDFKNDNDIAYAYIMIGSSYLAKSNYSEALTAFNSAYTISEKSKNYYQLHTIANNLGIVYKYTGDYDLALKYYANALNYAQEAEDLQSVVQSLTNIGNIYILQEDYDKGLNYYYSAIRECENKNTYLSDIPSIYNNIGYVYYCLDDTESSQSAYYHALAGFDSLNNTFGQAVVYNNLAELEILSYNYEKAENYIFLADSLHQLMDYNDSRKNLYFTTYQLYYKQSDYKRAIDYLLKYHTLKDSIYTLELENQVQEIKTKYQVDKLNSESKLKDDRIRQNNTINISLISVIVIITTLLGFLIKLILQKQKLNKLLNQSNVYLKRVNDEIEHNLQYAREIQISCMANNQNHCSYEHFILDIPKFTVGGDFYLMRQNGKQSIIVLADSTGHGISGGFLSVLGIQLLDSLLSQVISLSDILKQLNNSFYNYINSSNTLRSESLCLSIIKIIDNTVFYSGSKHKIYKYDNLEKQLLEYKTSSSIIGCEQDLSFPENSFTYNTGDWIFLFSDGYADQFDINNNKFKYNNFKSILSESADKTSVEMREVLLKKHLEWKGECEQTDDILIIGIKF
ncbi:MAG TPA: tetratricopeptide repeat protein [Bacteroidales bacterium]|nr:tetratricopeptide repeat protein [Bacteroidales bacterium]